MCWYSRRECLSRNGSFVRTFVVEYVNPVGWADLAAAAASAILSLLSLSLSSATSWNVPSTFSEQGSGSSLHSVKSTLSSSKSACCLFSSESTIESSDTANEDSDSSSDISLPPKSYYRKLKSFRKGKKYYRTQAHRRLKRHTSLYLASSTSIGISLSFCSRAICGRRGNFCL